MGLDVAGNEFGLSSVTCRGTGISPTSALKVTRHTSYSTGCGAGTCLSLERRGGVDSAWVNEGETNPVLVMLALLVFLLGENTFV